MSAQPSVADTLTTPLTAAPVTPMTVTRWRGGVAETVVDQLAEETPVAVLCNGEPHAVMLMSPADLDDFALGFALTEGLVAQPRELLLVEQRVLDDGIELDLTIPSRVDAAGAAQRAIAGRSGCGLCGKRMVQDALRTPPPVRGATRVSRAAIARTSLALAARQPMNRVTGAVHAAAWVSVDGEVLTVREDVGRHNALDKLIGALATQRRRFDGGFVLMTSRASYEIVQKAAAVGIAVVAAVSAPTGMAVRVATESGVTLVGFVRGERHCVYSHPERVH